MIFILTIIILCILALLFYMISNAFGNLVKEEELQFSNFPLELDSFTIFFISDIHRRTITDAIINNVKNKADIVVIGGDLAEKDVPFARISENLEKLTTIAPVFFIWGNNDYEVDLQHLEEVFSKYGITELKNDVYFMENDHIALIGVDDLTQELPPLELVFDIAGKNIFRILLSHNPDISNRLPENNRISLILSGHTHGGQIRIFGFGPYEIGQIKEKNGITQLISNGYGTSLFPLRLGAKAETHLITLKRKRS